MSGMKVEKLRERRHRRPIVYLRLHKMYFQVVKSRKAGYAVDYEGYDPSESHDPSR